MALDLDGVSDTNCADWEAFAFCQCGDDEDGEEDSPEGHPPPSSEGSFGDPQTPPVAFCDAMSVAGSPVVEVPQSRFHWTGPSSNVWSPPYEMTSPRSGCSCGCQSSLAGTVYHQQWHARARRIRAQALARARRGRVAPRRG